MEGTYWVMIGFLLLMGGVISLNLWIRSIIETRNQNLTHKTNA